jgi:hypothetical protein
MSDRHEDHVHHEVRPLTDAELIERALKGAQDVIKRLCAEYAHKGPSGVPGIHDTLALHIPEARAAVERLTHAQKVALEKACTWAGEAGTFAGAAVMAVQEENARCVKVLTTHLMHCAYCQPCALKALRRPE